MNTVLCIYSASIRIVWSNRGILNAENGSGLIIYGCNVWDWFCVPAELNQTDWMWFKKRRDLIRS